MMRRSVLWPFAVALVIGLAAGLTYSWAIDPLELVNTSPRLMRQDYRREWIRLAAVSYVADGDLERARTRMLSLDSEDMTQGLQELIETYAASGQSGDTMRKLSELAMTLDVHTPAMFIYVPATDIPTHSVTVTPRRSAETAVLPSSTCGPSWTPTVTASVTRVPASPSPTRTRLASTSTVTLSPTVPTTTAMPTWDPSVPSPTPIREFHIVSKEWVCKPQETPLIEVVLQDERGRGIGGAEVWLVWDSGADRAITGLKAERGVGFVDFEAVVGQSYALSIGQLGLPLVTDLEIAPCPFHAGAGASYGTWQITLQLRPVQTAIPTSPSSD